ncbi:hypothetical protein RB195_019932 [Necator americanus]|uniref:SAM domain-containing protein n=3 Tax=Necator americanus TaxID=51031 RepID=A0ABR1CI03_NECAM
MSDDGPPKLTSNASTASQEAKQQSRSSNGSAGLRNLAPRQQCSTTDMMRMVGTIPQGATLPRQLQTQSQASMRGSQGTPQMVQLHQVQQVPVTGRVITMNSMQAPQQLIPVPMRMVSNGATLGDGQQTPNSIQLMPQFLPANARIGQNIRFMPHPNDASNTHNVASQQAAMVSALRPGNAALMVVQGPNGPMVLNTSAMHPGMIPQNLVPVGIAQGIQGMQTMSNVQRQQQHQQQIQQHAKTMASRCKKRRPESGSGEMSVGEYLALGMDEKGRADSGSCGTDSPDTAGDAPPALDRGDSLDDSSPQSVTDSAKSLESIFVREAMAFRARGGGCGKPLVHYMDGFTIEESDVPFPLAQYDKITELVSSEVLDDIMPLIADIDVKNKVEEKPMKEKNTPVKPTKAATPTAADSENENKRKVPARTRRSTTQSEAHINKVKKEESDHSREDRVEERKQSKNRRQPAPVHHPPRRRTNELELLLKTGDEHDKAESADKVKSKQKRRSTQSSATDSPTKLERSRSSVDSSDTHSRSSKRSSGRHDRPRDKEKEKEREKESSVLSTPTISMRLLPSSEDSPEDRCLFCQVSFKEKERSVSTPQYCSTKCRRSYQSMIASEKMGRKFSESIKRVSGGSEGTLSSSSSFNDMRHKFEDETTPPSSSSSGKRTEDSSYSKKGYSAYIDPPQVAMIVPPRGVVSPASVQPSTLLASMTSPTSNGHSPLTEPTVGTTTPVAASCGPLCVPGVDYDVDPKLWTPDVAARWAQAVTGSETCAATFRREEVDGDAMLMMGFDDLRSHLSFTFGPAKKLHLAIEQLKVFRDQKYGTP